jgi:glycosyltransferase involved in cell wall biosynthesis
VHLHSFFAGLVGRLPVLDAVAGVPVVYQPHAWSTDLFPSAAASRLVTALERSGGHRTDVLVANCLDEIAAGRDLGVDLPSHELGVAVDASEYRPPTDAERAEARRSLGLEDERVLLVLGRVTRQKGQDLLVEAWEDRPLPGARLVLVGPGDTGALAALAPREWGRSVRAVGEPSAVLPWLWAADVLVLPSRYETVGLVVAEALSTGLPVVATAVHGARATIEEPGTLGASGLRPAGAVVPLGDMTALLDEAERRLTDAELHRRESAAALERAAQLFVPVLVAHRLEAAYRHAISIRNPDEPAPRGSSDDLERAVEEPYT